MPTPTRSRHRLVAIRVKAKPDRQRRAQRAIGEQAQRGGFGNDESGDQSAMPRRRARPASRHATSATAPRAIRAGSPSYSGLAAMTLPPIVPVNRTRGLATTGHNDAKVGQDVADQRAGGDGGMRRHGADAQRSCIPGDLGQPRNAIQPDHAIDRVAVFQPVDQVDPARQESARARVRRARPAPPPRMPADAW